MARFELRVCDDLRMAPRCASAYLTHRSIQTYTSIDFDFTVFNEISQPFANQSMRLVESIEVQQAIAADQEIVLQLYDM